ncbi:MAG: sedoheptulokinase [Saccharofermentanales bacterium]
MRAIGLDIGTTTICAVVIDHLAGTVLHSTCVANDTFLPSPDTWVKTQEPESILKKCEEIIEAMQTGYAPIGCIGLTGQMHGIVYVDGQGKAVSNLYTWQDGRGDLPFGDGKTYAGHLSELTGYKAATGFGCTTHFYNSVNRLVPKTAESVCTIQDYIAMRLTGETKPRIHASDAASLGLFRLQDSSMDYDAMEKAGFNKSFFPAAVYGFDIIGTNKNNIPVAVAIGDNQASFIGSVRNADKSVLINIGTGGQVSMKTEQCNVPSCMEIRPYMDHDFLLVGSSLCGGRAFSMLERFFRETTELAGFRCDSFYPALDRFLAKMDTDYVPAEFADNTDDLILSTKFAGTREDRGMRGSITNIGLNNFTPERLITGFLEGIAGELQEMYMTVGAADLKNCEWLVGSGNGIRKNIALQKILSRRFGLPMLIPVHEEEASYGAALYALVAIGCFDSLEKAQAIISYKNGA